MSSDSDVVRHVTWNFSHILPTSLNGRASRSLAIDPNTIGIWDCVKQLFVTRLMTELRPDCVTYVVLRVSRATVDDCVSKARTSTTLPDLPFEGYIQAENKVDGARLRKWFDAKWVPVKGRLDHHPAYKSDFLQPGTATVAAHMYFTLRGRAPTGIGGRPRKSPAVKYCATSVRPLCVHNLKAPCCTFMLLAHIAMIY